MAKFTVTINTGNDAFGDDPGHEIARILREIADRADQSLTAGRYFTNLVRDANGNTVGKFTFTK